MEPAWQLPSELHSVAGSQRQPSGYIATVRGMPMLASCYSPTAMFLGPYYMKERPRVHQMKLKYLRSLVLRGHQAADAAAVVRRFLRRIQKLEGAIRQRYHPEALRGADSKALVEMMVLDGCFVIELLLGHWVPSKVQPAPEPESSTGEMPVMLMPSGWIRPGPPQPPPPSALALLSMMDTEPPEESSSEEEEPEPLPRLMPPPTAGWPVLELPLRPPQPPPHADLKPPAPPPPHQDSPPVLEPEPQGIPQWPPPPPPPLPSGWPQTSAGSSLPAVPETLQMQLLPALPPTSTAPAASQSHKMSPVPPPPASGLLEPSAPLPQPTTMLEAPQAPPPPPPADPPTVIMIQESVPPPQPPADQWKRPPAPPADQWKRPTSLMPPPPQPTTMLEAPQVPPPPPQPGRPANSLPPNWIPFEVPTSWKPDLYRFDLVIASNQIPFFVLDALFQVSGVPELPGGDRNPALLRWLAIRYLLADTAHESLLTDFDARPPIYHLLHLVHSQLSITSQTQPQRAPSTALSSLLKMFRGMSAHLGMLRRRVRSLSSSNPPVTWWAYTAIPPARELHRVGVRFQAKATRSLLDVTFKDGTIEIPAFMYMSFDCHLLTNLVILESAEWWPQPTMAPRLFTSYAMFLSELINTDDDLVLLIQSKVVRIETAGNVAHPVYFFRYLAGLNGCAKFEGHFAELVDDISEYYNRLRNLCTSPCFRIQ